MNAASATKARVGLLLAAVIASVSSACIVASDEAPRGTAVRLGTSAPARAPGTTAPNQPAVSSTQAPSTPAAASREPTTGAAATLGQNTTAYTVQEGDTLFGLSRRTGVPVAEIARANGIPADSLLRTGQQLQIPALAPSTAPAIQASTSSTSPAIPASSTASAPPASASPAIRVAVPAPGATVRSPVTVEGTAAVFEGVVNIEILAADGTELTRTSANANQPDAGQPGPFRAEVVVPGSGERRVTVRVFWRSPRDGAPMDEVRIPVTLVG